MNLLARSVKAFKELVRGMQSESGDRTRLLYNERWINMASTLTPARLKEILELADAGHILEQHLLFADMEDRCEHLAAEMGKRKRALLTLDYEIVPAGESDEAVRVAKAVRELFEQLPAPEDLIIDLADGIGHGFAACEVEWGYANGLHLPRAFHFRPQSWFQVLPDNRNQLRLRDGSVEGAELNPFGWIVHTHKSRSGWLARYGLFRVVAWAYLVRSYALESNVNLVQIHGIPFRLGKYPAGSSEEDKKALYNGLRQLGRDAAGIVPDGMDILFPTVPSATKDMAGELIDRCERGMSKAILGGTLTTQADGKTSTNALGNVHDSVRHDLCVSDALQLASTLTRQVLAPLAVLNVGVSDPRLLPYFRFDTDMAADVSTLASALTTLAPYTVISRRWVHEKLKIPMASGPDDVFGAPSPKPANTGQAGLTRETPEAVALRRKAGKENQGEDTEQQEQAALDALENQPATIRALDDAQKRLLAQVVAAFADDLPPEDAMSRLATLFPGMDTAELEELLARTLFVASLYGQATVDGNSGERDA